MRIGAFNKNIYFGIYTGDPPSSYIKNFGFASFDTRFIGKLSKTCKTIEEAKLWLDGYLISCGFKFLSKEQAEKLKILL